MNIRCKIRVPYSDSVTIGFFDEKTNCFTSSILFGHRIFFRDILAFEEYRIHE